MEQAFAIAQKNKATDPVKKPAVSQGAYLILADRLRRTLDYLYEVLDFIEDYAWREQLEAILRKLRNELATFSQLLNQKDNPVLVQQIPTRWPLLYQNFLNQFAQLLKDTKFATPFAQLNASQQSWIHLVETEIKQVFESSTVLTLDELRAEAKARLLEINLKRFVDAHQSLLSTLKKPTCFISYAWGNQLQERQVHELAYLLQCAGIEVLLDIWCNKVNSIPSFTELVAKDKSDYVVVMGTPLLKQKYQVDVTGRGSWVYEELQQIAMRKHDYPNNHGIIKVLLEGPAEEAFPSFLSSLAHDFTDFQLSQHYSEKFINLLELLYAKYPALQVPIKQLRATLVADIETMHHLTKQQLTQSLQLAQVTDYAKIADRKQDVIEKLSQSFQVHFAELNPLSLWHVPVLSTNFIGRQSLLTILHDKLTHSSQAPISMAVCHGLGGVGKTQLALKYVYDHQHDYKYILWFSADSEEQLLNEYLELAKDLQLPIKDLSLSEIAEEVKAWLERNPGGLLVYDNAPNAELIEKFHPRIGGKLLITSRNNVWDQNQSLAIEIFCREESRAYISTLTGFALQDLQIMIDQLAETLGDLPLALAQACGYIAANQISLQEYLELYTDNRMEMLKDCTLPAEMHHDPVAVTWKITFKAIKEQQANVWPLLVSCAYLQANNIPEVLLKALFDEHISHGTLKRFKELLGCLQRYSLLKCNDRIEKIYSLHPLVQDVIRLEYEAAKQATSANELPEELNILMACLYAPFEGVEQNQFYRVIREYAPWIEHCSSFLKHVIADYKDTASLALAGFLDHMGAMIQVYSDQNHVRQAIIYHRQALKIRKQQLGPNDLYVAMSYNNLASVLQALGDQTNLKEAIGYHLKALKICEQQLDPNDLYMAMSYNNLASVLQALGDQINLKEAIVYHLKALKIRKQQLGPNDLYVAMTYNNLASVLQALGDEANLKKAIKYHHKALGIYEQQLGLDHPEVATSYNNLAMALQALGEQVNLEEAVRYHRKALKIRKQKLGPNHLHVAMSYNNLAVTLKNLGDQTNLEKAIKYHHKVLSIYKQQLGPDHLNVAISYNNLAMSLKNLGDAADLKQAIKYLHKALSIYKQQLDPDHPQVATSYHNLAEILQELGGQDNLKIAVKYYQKAIKIREQQLGSDHPELAKSYNNSAVVLRYLGGALNLKTAIEYHRKSLKIIEQKLGSNHLDVATSYSNLALALKDLGEEVNLKEVIEYHRKALGIYEQKLGLEHPLVVNSYNDLALALQDLGGEASLKESIKYHRKALKIQVQQLGSDHPGVGSTLLALAVAYAKEFNFQKAYESFKGAYSIFLVHPDYGPEHPYTQFLKAQIDKLEILSTSTTAPSSTHFFAKQKSTPVNVDKEKLQALLARYELAKVAVPLAYEIALRRAAGFGSEEELKLLLKMVKNVNVQDNDPTKRKTALHWAVEKGQVAHVKLLIAAGARADIKDASNKTALDYAQIAELRELLLLTRQAPASEAELKKENPVTTAESKTNCLTM